MPGVAIPEVPRDPIERSENQRHEETLWIVPAYFLVRTLNDFRGCWQVSIPYRKMCCEQTDHTFRAP